MTINMNEVRSVTFAKALADTTRQKIMELVCCQWLSVSEIVEHLQVTQPTVSHHLAVLRRADLVSVREEGKQSFYTLNQERLAACCGRLVVNFAPQTNTADAVREVEEKKE